VRRSRLPCSPRRHWRRPTRRNSPLVAGAKIGRAAVGAQGHAPGKRPHPVQGASPSCRDHLARGQHHAGRGLAFLEIFGRGLAKKRVVVARATLATNNPADARIQGKRGFIEGHSITASGKFVAGQRAIHLGFSPTGRSLRHNRDVLPTPSASPPKTVWAVLDVLRWTTAHFEKARPGLGAPGCRVAGGPRVRDVAG